ncbi:M61 family metallopeptidase [Arcticibacterium luteifluviistationis]|uniref:Peptidase n=1 Tax=Arcticibacterium luteifluviistationis TaxID=1784714 RepID=A0A2Z4G917_9BACT|nr:peptidase [Arcticibacterium luteifluviistationis]AWV97580.1 peptidase [Arcticibacterium luteifluviistationis]
MNLFKTLALLLFAGPLFSQTAINFEIDVTKNTDTFYVSVDLEKQLSKENNIYQFAATAPGTYQTQNIGRFISDFKAFNKKGKEIKVTYKAPNQYIISKPHKVKSINYKVAETFDTEVESYPVYMMCGSSIENDHALINTHTMLGYFEGLQSNPLKIKVTGQEGWKTGTALESKDGYYLANSFDHAVDSPILTGNLTYAETQVADTPIRIFTYSEKGKYTSEALLENMKDMLAASNKFLIKLPVENYTFLYYFLQNPDGQTGAWEHSYSSEYVLTENEPTDANMKQVTDIASHEFFHIVTPLNIHSEIIESFNFVEPTPSQHLWLYEGVTEWASNILLYRGGVVDFDAYIKNSIRQKIIINENYFDKSWSLERLAKESFNEDGAKQYGNIYYKGALVAGYLDIRLLELSDGKRGLRELMLELVDKYGKGRPISEKGFFKDLVQMTYPEIGDFIHDYIQNAEPLPNKEYLGKIGLNYSGNGKSIEIRKMVNPTDKQLMLFEAWSKNL